MTSNTMIQFNLVGGGSLSLTCDNRPAGQDDEFNLDDLAKSTTFKNILINGEFKVSQRFGGANIVPNDKYTLDRWIVRDANGTGGTVHVTAVPDGAKLTTLGATNYSYFMQRVEPINIPFGKTVTITADITANSTVRANITVSYMKNGHLIESSSSAAEEITGKDRTSFTMNVRSDSTDIEYMYVILVLKGDTSDALGTNTITVHNMQMELGYTFTGYEDLPYDIELIRCRRYYEELRDSVFIDGYAASGGVGTQLAIPCVPKRSIPTIAVNWGAAGNIMTKFANYKRDGLVYIQVKGAATGRVYVTVNDMKIDSEIY